MVVTEAVAAVTVVTEAVVAVAALVDWDPLGRDNHKSKLLNSPDNSA